MQWYEYLIMLVFFFLARFATITPFREAYLNWVLTKSMLKSAIEKFEKGKAKFEEAALAAARETVLGEQRLEADRLQKEEARLKEVARQVNEDKNYSDEIIRNAEIRARQIKDDAEKQARLLLEGANKRAREILTQYDSDVRRLQDLSASLDTQEERIQVSDRELERRRLDIDKRELVCMGAEDALVKNSAMVNRLDALVEYLAGTSQMPVEKLVELIRRKV